MSFSRHPQADELVAFAEELADAARDLLSTRHESGRFETKEDASPVTEFDRGVESRLRDMIRARYPEHGIIGEEFPPEREDSELLWIMDPIDGTKPFVVGIPVFTTLVSLCVNGAPVVGVIDASATKDRWVGVQGRATTLNGRQVTTSGRVELDGATLAWSQPDRVLDQHVVGHAELTERVAWTVFGAAAFGFGRLAAGSLDIAVCSGAIGAYDVCALVPIVEGAGGRITDDEDQPLTIRTPHACIAAATPQLHAETLRVLNGE